MRVAALGRRRGATIIELMVTSMLMVIVALILARTWAVFGRSAIATVARARIAQEANLAAAALVKDFGLLARPPDKCTDTRYVNIQPSIDGTSISFSIDDGTGTSRIIQYARDQTDSSKLVRTDLTAPPGSGRVVATLVAGFEASALTTLPNEFNATGVQIDLTLTHRTYDRDLDGAFRGDHTRRFTLFVPDALQ
jgi:hypothetical protein